MTRTGRPPTPPEDRFFRFVTEDGDCWMWTGTTNSGYGHFSLAGGRRVYAHRWSYEFFRAEIPAGLTIDHLCRNRRCVNPWHLEPVTPRVNNRRAPGVITTIRANQTRCVNGHEFTPANTITTPRGRECRVCRLEIYRRYRRRKKEITHV